MLRFTYFDIRYALPYQPMSSTELNAAVILGIAWGTVSIAVSTSEPGRSANSDNDGGV